MIMKLAALLSLTASLSAQSIIPGTGYALTPSARAQLDSMAKRSASLHVEQMACVTGYAVRDSVFIIGDVQPARHIAKADSLAIWMTGPACEWWQPIVHSHVTENAWFSYATPIDTHTAAVRGVFGFLMSVKKDSTWTLRAYP